MDWKARIGRGPKWQHPSLSTQIVKKFEKFDD